MNRIIIGVIKIKKDGIMSVETLVDNLLSI